MNNVWHNASSVVNVLCFSFETWFDVTVLSDESADVAIIEEEKKTNILTMLHQVTHN